MQAQVPSREVSIGLYIDDITRVNSVEEIITLEVTRFLRWQSPLRPKSSNYYFGMQVPAVSYVTYFQAILLFFYLLIASQVIVIVIGYRMSKENNLIFMRWA